MTSRRQLLRLATLLALSCPAGAWATVAQLPADSIYQLPVVLRDQEGRAIPMASLRGPVRIVTMFYTQCSFACPLSIDTMKALRAQLSPEQQQGLQMLLISLDPERDAVPALKKAMQQRELDSHYWTMTRAAREDVRKVAAVLGVQYRQLVDMEINHSSILTLIDGQGRVRARTNKTGEVDSDFLAVVKKVLDEDSATRRNTSNRPFGT